MLGITNRKMYQIFVQLQRIENKKLMPCWQFNLDDNSPSNNLEYLELCEYYPPSPTASDSPLPKGTENQIHQQCHEIIGSANLMQRLKDSSAQHILFFIHGYAQMPKDAFKKARKLQRLFDEQQNDFIEIVGIIWPCDNDFGPIKDYWDDQQSADMSGFSFARALNKLYKWQADNIESRCRKKIHILAHSMGNRVLRETLRVLNKYTFNNGGIPRTFQNIFMVAADVVNETLEKGESGRAITDAAAAVIIAHAWDDGALGSSKGANFITERHLSKRMGQSGPEDRSKVSPNVVGVDCSLFNNEYDTKWGHTYFLEDCEGNPGKLCNYIFKTIQGKSPTSL